MLTPARARRVSSRIQRVHPPRQREKHREEGDALPCPAMKRRGGRRVRRRSRDHLDPRFRVSSGRRRAEAGAPRRERHTARDRRPPRVPLEGPTANHGGGRVRRARPQRRALAHEPALSPPRLARGRGSLAIAPRGHPTRGRRRPARAARAAARARGARSRLPAPPSTARRQAAATPPPGARAHRGGREIRAPAVLQVVAPMASPVAPPAGVDRSGGGASRAS